MGNRIPTSVGTFRAAGDVTLHMRLDGAWDRGGDGRGGSLGASPNTPVIYLHSLGTDLRIFDEVVARLPERRHVRFDLRGHGLSDAPATAYTIEGLAADAFGALDAAGVERAVFVGVSVGGLIALRAALDRQERVAALLLSGTAAKIGEEDVWEARRETVAEQGTAALADSTLLRWFSEAFREANEPLVDGYRNRFARTPAAGYAGTCAALAGEDLRKRLVELRPPTLVVGGSDDLSTPPPTVREFARGISGARLEIIDDAGHLPMVDSPERFTELLRAFLEENERG